MDTTAAVRWLLIPSHASKTMSNSESPYSVTTCARKQIPTHTDAKAKLPALRWDGEGDPEGPDLKPCLQTHYRRLKQRRARLGEGIAVSACMTKAWFLEMLELE